MCGIVGDGRAAGGNNIAMEGIWDVLEEGDAGIPLVGLVAVGMDREVAFGE